MPLLFGRSRNKIRRTADFFRWPGMSACFGPPTRVQVNDSSKNDCGDEIVAPVTFKLLDVRGTGVFLAWRRSKVSSVDRLEDRHRLILATVPKLMFSRDITKGALTTVRGALFSSPSLGWHRRPEATLPGSSVAEQVTVNHLVVGSIPTRAAIFSNSSSRFLFSLNLIEVLGHA